MTFVASFGTNAAALWYAFPRVFTLVTFFSPLFAFRGFYKTSRA